MATRKDLICAIVSGKVRRVKRVLRQLRIVDVKLCRLLVTLAVNRKDPKIAKSLIQYFARTNKQKIISSFTISLLYATYRGYLTIVKILLKNGVNVNSQSRNGCCALHFAVLKNRLNVLKYLIKNGARADLKARGVKNCGFTPLHYCAVHGRKKCASILLKYNSDVVNPKGPEDIHPIHLSISYSEYKVTSLLLSYVYNINVRFPKSIYETVTDIFYEIFELPNEEPTLLHWAVAKSDIATIKILLNNGANVNLKTRSLMTPLMIAAQVADLEPLQIILEQRPSVNEVDCFGNNALHYVYNVLEAHRYRYFFIDSLDYQDDTDKLELLLKFGADIFTPCSFNFNRTLTSILDLAIYFGRSLAVRLLLYKTAFGFKQLNYSMIELAAFDINAIDESDRNDIQYIESLQIDALKIQSYLASYIENRHAIGIYATDYDLKKVQAFVSEIKISKSDFYYQEEKKIMLESENLLKSLQVGLTGMTCWNFILENREKLVKRAFGPDFITGFNFFNFHYDKRTFYYANLFSYKVHYAIAKKDTLGKCIEIISDLFMPLIPYDCCVAIATHFSNEELKQFVFSFKPLNFRYRYF